AQPLLMGVKYATYEEFTTGIDQFHSHAPRVACGQNGRNTMQLFHGSVELDGIDLANKIFILAADG
ncbi:MAG: hypothetical protein CMO67_05650, partial [Verrucomicrobiales bacterium]|nr:hypothetical protein [Verrucomicrobiales bacterium]